MDPVRYISNLSTGRMGYEVAREAARLKFDVTLISGPAHLRPPAGVRFVGIETVDELEQAVHKEVKGAALLVMTAAVNDYVPERVAKQKLRRQRGGMILKLVRTRDIVAGVARKAKKLVVVGFSLETQSLAERTLKKLHAKNLDLIVGNEYSKGKNPFGENKPTVLIVGRKGPVCRLVDKPKDLIARKVILKALSLYKEKCGLKRNR